MADDLAPAPQPAASGIGSATAPLPPPDPNTPALPSPAQSGIRVPLGGGGDYPPPQPHPPLTLLDRFMNGTAIGRVLKEAGEGVRQGWGDAPLAGTSPEDQTALHKLGLFAVPALGPTGVNAMPGALTFGDQVAAMLAGSDAFLRSAGTGILGAAGGIGQAAEETGAIPKGGGASLGRDLGVLGNTIATLMGAQTPFARFEGGPKGVRGVPVGSLARADDFAHGATAIAGADASPALEAKLQSLYEERGVHPAEAAHDAQTNPVIAQQLLSDHPSFPDAYGGGEPALQRAYHGSPHEFEQFDSSKIGTGEGAQAYGHGLYFAGKREIAEHYRDRLSSYRDQATEIAERHIGGKLADNAAQTAENAGRLMSIARDSTRTDEQRAKAAGYQVPEVRGMSDAQRLAMLNEIRDSKPGKLYTVNLAPAEDDYLHWDKPLSEQSEKVRGAINAAHDQLTAAGKMYGRPRDSATGAQIYRGMSEALADQTPETPSWTSFRNTINDRLANDREASLALRDAGVRGIRYLDQGSRGAGEGSHNFVIFDDKDVSIEAAERRGVRAPSPQSSQERGEIVRIAPNLYGEVPTPAFLAAHDHLVQAVNADIERMAPGVRARGAAGLWAGPLGGEVGPVQGAYYTAPLSGDRLARVITYALEAEDPQATVRHEIVHDLKRTGLLSSQEWDRLLIESVRQDWLTRHNIEGRYPELADAGRHDLMHEEAIAEAFSQWRQGKYSNLPPTVRIIFQKIQEFLRTVANSVRHVMGDQVTAHDIFSSIESGEVGSREAGPEFERGTAAQRPTIDQTDQGAQPVLPGAERLTPEEMARRKAEQDKAQAERDMAQKARGGQPQRAADELPLFGGKGSQGTLFQRPEMPKEPIRLATWLRMMGGVRDEGGDIRHSLGGAKYRPGLINSKGMPLDDAALKAWESGYFPGFGENRPSINDLREAIDQDVRGRPRYSEKDDAQLQAYREHVEANHELDQLTHQYGIDSNGKTRAQIFDEIAERVSAEHAASIAKEQEASAEEAFRQAEEKARSEMAEDFDPQHVYNEGEPRSLEDLEREYQSEQAAGKPEQGKSRALVPGGAGGGQGALQEGAGPRGDLAGAGRRDLAPARSGGAGGGGEPPAGQGRLEGPPGQPPSFEDSQRKILDKINIGGKDPQRKLTWRRLYTATLDKLFPISHAVQSAEPDLATPDNPYHLARLLAGAAGKADHFLNYGSFDFNSYANTGPSLKAILEPVNRDLNGFRAFAASVRALELEGRGITSGLDVDAARHVAAAGLPKYGETLAGLIDYQNKVAAYLRDSGVLSGKAYDAMLEANRLYIPFSRFMDDREIARGAFGKASIQARNPIKRIEGSTRDIIDPLESIIRNTFLFTQMAEKNAVGVKLVDMLQRANEGAEYHRALLPTEAAVPRETLPPPEPGAARLPEIVDPNVDRAIHDYLSAHGVTPSEDLIAVIRTAAAPPEGDEIAIFRDGKRETYKVDPDLARAMKGLDAQSMGLLEKILSFPANILRAGAVLTPDFALRHTFRDYIYAAVTSKGAFSPVDMAKGLMSFVAHDPDYQSWLKGGGANNAVVSLDRRYLQENLRELTSDAGLMRRSWNVVTSPLHALQMLTELAENMSHVGAFKKALREAEAQGAVGKPEIQSAAFVSRDTAVDAARIGASMRAYNAITAFANITLQDTDRIARAFIARPAATSLRVAAGIMAPSALLWWANHDDERYQELPQWEKDLFWIIMTKDHIWRVPKPFGAGVIFGSGTERAMEAFAGDNPEAFKRFGQSIGDTVIPQFFPTAAAPVIDQFANRSTFTNRTLIPSPMEKYLPEYQYTPYTTELSKALGQIIGAFPGISTAKTDPDAPLLGGASRALSSPILMENYIRGWSGTLGVYALTAVDASLRKAGVLPDPPKPASTLSDIPVIKAFTVRYPTATTQSIQDFYDKYEVNKRYYDTWQAMAKEGNVEAMQRIADAKGPEMFVQLDGIRETLSEHSQLIRDIWKDPEMPPDEKRQLIDELYYNEIQVGRFGKAMLEQIERSLATVH